MSATSHSHIHVLCLIKLFNLSQLKAKTWQTTFSTFSLIFPCNPDFILQISPSHVSLTLFLNQHQPLIQPFPSSLLKIYIPRPILLLGVTTEQ
ncbi:hypothetical protein RchiOBHm_Chr1g0374631 [Rosa chinensis]|uniref:Uncharacterized protein n=1 Tax=Rosa chinensis TaxID=74649 RepID=A0A2P6SME8_ROSCH|nr:hypothetical protein RchiOBHm_Chr1g0374631 [Rosa chinensis]